jgi:molybdopterin converting factor small subunit
MDGKWFRSIILLSLDAIENPTIQDSYRRICRWYSKNFNTALHEVEGLDPEFVLRAYWEDYIYELAEKASEGDEKAETVYEEFIGALIKDNNEIEKEVDEDEKLLEEMRQQLAKEKEQKKEKANKNKDSDQPSDSTEEPNLKDIEEQITIPSEDDIDFDEE